MSSSKSQSQRTSLSRERIVLASIELAADQGIDGLSMRKLAAHLDVGVMSLYNYVSNKDELLEVMVDYVAGQVAIPSVVGDWKAVARELAVLTYEALMAHPWSIGIWSKQWPGAHRWRLMETLLEVLASAGLPEDISDLGFHAISNHIQGFAQQRLNYTVDTLTEEEMGRRFERDVSEDDFPFLVEHVRFHAQEKRTHNEFEFVLDLILDGLERLK